MSKTLRLLFSLFWLTACAQPSLKVPTGSEEDIEREQYTQYDKLFEAMLDSKHYAEEVRVMNVTYPLLRAGAELCDKHTTAEYGFMLYDPDQFSTDSRSYWYPYESHIVNEGMRVLFSAKDFPAYKAGIKARTRITAIGGMEIAGKKTREIREKIEEYAENSKPLPVQFQHRGSTKSVTLNPVTVCNFPPIIKRNAELNAYADGKNIYVTASMLRFVESDDELALVMGHEIAHNALTHITKKAGNIGLGMLTDLLLVGTTGVNSHGFFSKMSVLAYSKTFESEADYMGIYLMERAGYNSEGVADFWRRMGIESPRSIAGAFLSTHPSNPERFVTIEQTIAEIAKKRKQGEALLPNKR